MNKYSFLFFVALSSLFFMLACGRKESSEAEKADQEAVERQQQQYQTAQPIPTFDWSLERDVAIQLYRARNERVSTWAVWRSDLGTVEGDCPSIGYPLPYDTSLTNPLRPIWGWSNSEGHRSGGVAVEMPEPNGLYPSKNSIATWVRCVVEANGERVEAPIYTESKVTAYPFPVNVDYDKNRVTPVAGKMPSVTIDKK